MAKHPTSSRVHKGDQAPDDAFVASVKRAYTWGRENSRTVTVALAVILVVGIGAFWFFSQQRDLENRAAERFTAVQQTLASGNAELVIRDLESYLERFGNTRSGDQARLVLAGVLMQQDRPSEAVAALDDLPSELDEPFGLAAARLQAAAHEEAGQIEEAVDAYLRLAENARFTFQQREALADAARVRLQNGDPDRAASLYERVVDTFEQTDPGRSYYQMWLAEAEAQAEQGAGTTPTTPEPAAGSDTATG